MLSKEIISKNLETLAKNKEVDDFYRKVHADEITPDIIPADDIAEIAPTVSDFLMKTSFLSGDKGLDKVSKKEQIANASGYILTLYVALIQIAKKNNDLITEANAKIIEYNKSNPEHPRLLYPKMPIITPGHVIQAYKTSHDLFLQHQTKYGDMPGFENLERFNFNDFFSDLIKGGFTLREPPTEPGGAFVWNPDAEARMTKFGKLMQKHFNNLGPQFSSDPNQYIFWSNTGKQFADKSPDALQNTVWANLIFNINDKILWDHLWKETAEDYVWKKDDRSALGQFSDYFMSNCYLSAKYADEGGKHMARTLFASKQYDIQPIKAIYVQNPGIIGADSVFWNYELNHFQQAFQKEAAKLDPDSIGIGKINPLDIIQVYSLKEHPYKELKKINDEITKLQKELAETPPSPTNLKKRKEIAEKLQPLQEKRDEIMDLSNKENWHIRPLREATLAHYSKKLPDNASGGLTVAKFVPDAHSHPVTMMPLHKLHKIAHKFKEKGIKKKEKSDLHHQEEAPQTPPKKK